MEADKYTNINVGRDVKGNLIKGVVQGDIIANNFGDSSEDEEILEVALEIRQLLEKLEKVHSTNSTSEKMALASEAVNRIENNQLLQQRVLSAVRVGGTQALSQALNHPVASFIIAALEDWQKSRRT